MLMSRANTIKIAANPSMPPSCQIAVVLSTTLRLPPLHTLSHSHLYTHSHSPPPITYMPPPITHPILTYLHRKLVG
jgi:hypothetical protein